MINLRFVPLLIVCAMPADAQPGARESLLAADQARVDSASRGIPGPGLADDVLYLHPGAPIIRGADAVRRLWATQPRLAWQPLRVEVSNDGRAGATFGVVAAPGDGVPILGRYLAYWRRNEAGWRVAALMHAHPASAPLPDGVDGFLPDTVGTGARGEAERADRAFAADAAIRGAGPAFAAAAAPDAMMFIGPGLIGVGPAEIGAAFPGGSTWTWRPVASGASGDLAFTVGEAEITSGPEIYHSKYLTVWRRQPDGSWKFLTDGGNARPAP